MWNKWSPDKMNKHVQVFFRIAIILSTCLLVTGCKKENPSPELLDPIYRDLSDEAKKFEKLKSDKEKEILSLLEDRPKLKVGSVLKKINSRDLIKARAALIVLRQKAKYYKIHAERRRVEGRKAYKLAFKEGLPWPDPKEYERYKAHKKLRNAPRNWNYRVPKLRSSPNFKEKEDKEENKEAE